MKTPHWLARTALLVKEEGIEKLQQAHILVVGLGGVGGFVAEFLARAGVGTLTLIDGDVVDETNINRQIIALQSTIGKPKAEVLAQRLRDINPQIKLHLRNDFLEPDAAHTLIGLQYDFVADCIDSISPKIALIKACSEKKIPLISAMGAGGATDPSKVRIANITDTRDCPLARLLRKRLKALRIHYKFKAVYSTELPDKSSVAQTDGTNYKRSYYGTISYMPALFGIHLSGYIIRTLLAQQEQLAPQGCEIL